MFIQNDLDFFTENNYWYMTVGLSIRELYQRFDTLYVSDRLPSIKTETI